MIEPAAERRGGQGMTDMEHYCATGRRPGDAGGLPAAIAGWPGSMAGRVQQIVTQGGEVMVVLPLAHFQFLSAMADPHPTMVPVHRCAPAFSGGTEPAEIARALATGESPVAAWRKYRGLTQSALARQAGVSRFTIMRMETAGAGSGNRNTRRCIAAALDIPFDRI